jgi:peptide deformylase
MAIREIVTTPEPVLRERARKVSSITSDTSTLIDDMIETMRVAPGVGLAAPQVGVSQRVIVVEYGEGSNDPDTPSKPPKLYAVVNPKIVRHSHDTELGNEACLSIPGYVGEVERYHSVTVKGLNRHDKPFRLKAKGWLARIFQHEIDHLDGILYIDRADQMWRMEERKDFSESTPAV